MNNPPKDFTKQELLVAEVLSDLGLRFEQQVNIGKYIVDFLIFNYNGNIVIEADGIYGHFRADDRKRDAELRLIVKDILHIKGNTKDQIKQQLMEKLCQE